MKNARKYTLWIAVAALVAMALQDFGLISDTSIINEYVDKLLYIAILLGIVDEPTEEDSKVGDFLRKVIRKK
jgi:uncharacterized membrane protein